MDNAVIQELIKFLEIYIPACITTVGIVGNINASRKIKLQRQSFSGEIICGVDSLIRKYSTFSTDVKYRSQKLIGPFVDKLINYIPNEDTKLLNENIQTLKVRRKKPAPFSDFGGIYIYDENKILYHIEEDLGHELLHTASYIYDPRIDTYFSGFSQEDEKNCIGRSLNEGYTELLNYRIFGVSNKDLVYNGEIIIAKLIELFFEDEKEMMHMYFNCNLSGFVDYMEKYAPREEIIKLITDIDDYSILKKSTITRAKIKTISIYERLYKWFVAKCDDQEKIKKMEELIKEDKIATFVLDNIKEEFSDNSKKNRTK